MVRDTLTRERVVEEAIRLLDTDGIDGLSMRRLGSRLGSAATAVYWHVTSKDNLIALASDQVWHEIVLPDIDAIGWRAAAVSMATGLHAMLQRHVWLLEAFGSFLSYGVGKARHDDHMLAVYQAAGFEGAEAAQAGAAVFTFVIGNALGPAATVWLTRKLSREGDAKALMREAMAKARQIAVQFPRLRGSLATAGADYGAAPENTFDFGLKALLDGIEAQRGIGRGRPAAAAGRGRGDRRSRGSPTRSSSR